MNRMAVQIRILRLDIAIACFVLNSKNAMIRATAIPPPPIPATVHKAMIKANVNTPIISVILVGKTPL